MSKCFLWKRETYNISGRVNQEDSEFLLRALLVFDKTLLTVDFFFGFLLGVLSVLLRVVFTSIVNGPSSDLIFMGLLWQNCFVIKSRKCKLYKGWRLCYLAF